MFTDFHQLVGALFQKSLGNNELDIISGYKYLLKTIFNPAKGVGNKSKTRRIKNSFLNSGDKTKSQLFTYFTHFTKKVQIQDQRLIFSCSKIVQKFINNQQQPFIWIDSVESCHHIFKSPLVTGDRRCIRKSIIHSHLLKTLFKCHH